jgi:methylamine dehydrogenase accessory protein MauD
MNEIWVVSYFVLWILAALLVFVVLGLLRQLGTIQIRLGPEPGALITEDGLKRGAEAPNFQRPDALTGRMINLKDLVGRQVLLLFLSPTCESCRTLVPDLNRLMTSRRDELAVLAVCPAGETACGQFARRFDVRVPFVADPDNGISTDYDVQRTPFAFLISSHGRVLIRGVVNSWPQIEALVKQEGTLQGSMEWVPMDPGHLESFDVAPVLGNRGAVDGAHSQEVSADEKAR